MYEVHQSNVLGLTFKLAQIQEAKEENSLSHVSSRSTLIVAFRGCVCAEPLECFKKKMLA